MELIWMYGLFAITTAVVAMYELIWPVIQQIRITHSETVTGQYWKTSLFVFFLLSLLAAPFLIVACLVPNSGVKFRDALYTNLQITQ